MILPQPTGVVRGEGFHPDYTLMLERDRSAEPGRIARASARVRGGSLDRALSAGADPRRSPQLAARAAILTSRRTRDAVAEGLERLVDTAHGPHRRWWAVGQHEPVLANAAELHSLARVLHGAEPVRPRGMAILNRLLVDGTGPAYNGDRATLDRRLSDARAELVLERAA
jgi:hypothetical protein